MDFNQSGFKIKDGKIKLSHSYNNIPLEKEYIDNGLYQAFDLGIGKQTAVNIDGKFFEVKNRRPEKYWEKKIEKAQSRLDHCKKEVVDGID
jgi:hypothetical protein